MEKGSLLKGLACSTVRYTVQDHCRDCPYKNTSDPLRQCNRELIASDGLNELARYYSKSNVERLIDIFRKKK